MKRIVQILTIITLAFAVIGGLYAYDKTLAKVVQLAGVEFRLDQKILSDRQAQLQNQIWKIEDRYGTNVATMSQEVRYKYRRLLFDLKRVEKKLQKLRGGNLISLIVKNSNEFQCTSDKHTYENISE